MTKVSESFKKLNPGFTGKDFVSGPPPAKPSVAPTQEDLTAANEMCDAADAPRLERDLQKLCQIELQNRGVSQFLHLSPRAREKIGWPDLTFPWQGRFCACELKTKTGTLTPEQKETLDAIQAPPMNAIVATIRGLIQFRRFLDKIKEDHEAKLPGV